MKYKIIETLNDFRILALVPKMKCKKNFLGWTTDYYDGEDLEWVYIDDWGHPIRIPLSNYGNGFLFVKWPITFKTFKEAESFVKKIRKEKLEIIL